MAFKGLSPDQLYQTPLGNHEVQVRNCHRKHKGAMNILSGLTLVTRHQIDEGKLVKKKTFKKLYFTLLEQLSLQRGLLFLKSRFKW